MNITRFKFMAGVSAFAMLGALALLAASHTTVGVVAFNYGETNVVAEVQADSLDKVAVAEKAKAKMTVASDDNYKAKIKTDKMISDSFAKTKLKVDEYAKVINNKGSTNETIVAANLALDAELFKRFDQTRDSYQLAANSLISNGIASMGSRQASFNRQGSIDIACSTVTRAVIKSDQFICAACFRSEPETVKI